MKPRLYLETTIPSYLTAWISRDLVMAGHQQTTREWWENRREDFEIFVSVFVLDEAASGDAGAAKKRMELLADIPVLKVDERAIALANRILASCDLPAKAATDAAHIAVAAVNGMEFLLTWNCAHLANAEFIPKIRECCEAEGYTCPTICTPEELMGLDL
jgi:PIN domain